MHVHEHFEHRQTFPDAVAGSHREGDVGKSVPFLGIGARKAFRQEVLRIAPKGRMPVQQIGTDENVGARRDRIAAEFVRLQRAAREQPAGRIQAQGLLNHLVGEGERLGRVQSQRARRHGVGFGGQLRGSLWMLADQIPGPGQRCGGGFVSCHDESQHLIDHFLVAHGLFGLAVAGIHEHRQQIEALLRLAAAARDQFGDQFGQ